MLDSLIEEAAERFDLGEQAAALVSSLLSMISDREHGRIRGFLDAFREEGMESEVASWVAEGPVRELTAEEVTTGLGPAPIVDLAERLSVEPARVAAALGFLIPHVLDLLTPGGEVPEDETLLARVGAWLAGSVPVAAVGRTTAVQEPPAQPVTKGPDGAPRRRVGLVAIAAGIALLALIWLAGWWNGADEGSPPQPPRDSVATQGAPPAAQSLTEQPPESEAAADRGEAARVAASSAEATDPRLVTEPSAFNAAAAADEAQGEALEALSALGPDFSPAELVAALNLGAITFAHASAAITPETRELLERAAAMILAAPSETRIEIGGHTDSQGVERRNLALSQARAEAVRNTLVDLGVPRQMLIPRGYGSRRPVADDATGEGRFRNRRIEFAVVGGD